MYIEKPTRTFWRDGAIAGLVGGLAMLAYAAATLGSAIEGFWFPLPSLARTMPFMPPPTAGWNVVPFLYAAALHLLSAAAWGVGYAAVVAAIARSRFWRPERSWLEGTMLGLALGVAAYAVMGLLLQPVMVNGLRLLSPGQFFVSHLVFGLVTGLVLTALDRRPEAAITFAPDVPVGADDRERDAVTGAGDTERR